MITPGPSEFEGILLVDKPKEHTSHDVIARLRKKLQMKRIGHAGTLDPMATGLLVVLIGKATKASQYIVSLDKEYTGTIELGVVTNSQDADGETMSTSPVPDLTPDEINRHMQSFIGDQYQMPPMHSAIKVDGVPLYKLAHKGKEIEREPRFIRIDRFELLGYERPRIRFRLQCSKGTYVRTVAHDLGARIGCGAHLSELVRTATDKFHLDQALPLEEILELPVREIGRRLIPVRDAVPRALL
jgi:tRNA pseudouridine55 synthase